MRKEPLPARKEPPLPEKERRPAGKERLLKEKERRPYQARYQAMSWPAIAQRRMAFWVCRRFSASS